MSVVGPTLKDKYGSCARHCSNERISLCYSLFYSYGELWSLHRVPQSVMLLLIVQSCYFVPVCFTNGLHAQYFLVVFQLNQWAFDYSTGKRRVRFAISHEMGQYCRNVVALRPPNPNAAASRKRYAPLEKIQRAAEPTEIVRSRRCRNFFGAPNNSHQ